MATLTEIESLCADFSAARAALEDLTEQLREERRKAVRNKIAHLRCLVVEVNVKQETLMAAVEASPELFERPRTRSFDGVKVGYRKSKGKVVIADEAKTIERIDKLLPTNQAELLVRVRKSVDKTAVVDLTAADLKRLGIAIEEDTDAPVVAFAKTDLDALVDALLADEGEDE